MANASNCTKGADMPDIWAIVVIIIILMVIYTYISSKISDQRKRKVRENTIPQISDALKTGVNYNIVISDGPTFENVQILGSVEGDDDQFSFANWKGMLVIQQENKKRVFIKKTSIRFIEEL